jgi:uncharacterized protein YneF (UPF0154 family)
MVNIFLEISFGYHLLIAFFSIFIHHIIGFYFSQYDINFFKLYIQKYPDTNNKKLRFWQNILTINLYIFCVPMGILGIIFL